jgi:glycosyltransferase involved in cell wall biosynthesis
MRILFVNPVGQIGGAERVLLDCIASIRQLEPEHDLHLLLMDDGPLAQEARRLGAMVKVLPAPGVIRVLGDSAIGPQGRLGARVRLLAGVVRAAPATWRYVRQLRCALGDIQPDLIHSNGLKSHLLVARTKPQAPIVWHIHDFIGRRGLIARVLRRHSGCVTLIAVSKAVAQDIARWLPGSSVRVVLNGVDLARFTPGSESAAVLDELAHLAPAADSVVRIGLVATYARWKGQDVFLRAASHMLQQTRTRARFYVIGGPIYSTHGSQFSQQELARMAQQLGLVEHVGFVPFQADPLPVYRALDIVVHASTRPEPFGLTIAEAMAAGRAVVASVAGAASELFTNGKDALGVAPGDVEALAKALMQLAGDPGLRSTLGSNARATAERRFDRQRMAAEVLAIEREAFSDGLTKSRQ